MKLFRALLLLAAGLTLEVGAQIPTAPLSIGQNAFLYDTNVYSGSLIPPGINWLSTRGYPLNSTNNSAAGSDGRGPTAAQQLASQTNGGNSLLFPTTVPTSNQFRGLVIGGAVPVLATNKVSLLNTNASFAQNVPSIRWPAQYDGNGNVLAIQRAAQVGAPYLIRLSSFPFGAVIPPPSVDETGAALPIGANLTYWFSAPYTPAGPTNYYYSPNALVVFATQPGQAVIVWEKAVPTNAAPTNLPSNVGFVQQGAGYYLLYTNTYLVSGIPVQTPQKMYWTEGDYVDTGHPVTVPQATVQKVNIIYSTSFPQFVAAPGDVDAAFVGTATNTLWFDTALNEIRADNVSGRVFVELLGQVVAGGARAFLGFEILDVSPAPPPVDVNVELGTRIGAFQDGSDDTQLTSAPLSGTAQFYYQQSLPNNIVNLYATALTVNTNDFQCYWLISGVAGLQWPLLFNRYHEYWPSDPSHYVNYVRPYVTTAAQAAQTAVQLPANESPSIAFQDIFTNRAPASLDSSGRFYTFLDLGHPAHRTLLQFLSGTEVAYERVFSWLDTALVNNALLAGEVASNNPSAGTSTLAGSVGGALSVLTMATNGTYLNFAVGAGATPYVITNTINVGDRIPAPPNELGAAGGTGYLAGSIVQAAGNSFNPLAYLDPFTAGFDAANLGAIIPVNAVPTNNTLEVLWFRQDTVNTALGFQSSYWPAVIGYYNVRWPATPTNEIILAGNAGSHDLTPLTGANVYAQNNPALPGYNPNEEHALILGNTAYALRDDLNNTNAAGYTSYPYVLISYTAADGRPAMVPFHVRREAPEQGILFDYVANAGTILQAPMPLPLLALPVEGDGAAATNYNTAPPASSGDLPAGWNNLPANSPLAYYGDFTFQDRKHEFWVYRGLNSGLPSLQFGAYNTTINAFGPLSDARAVQNQPFAYYLPVSRQLDALTMTATNLPPGLSLGLTTNGNTVAFAITGIPIQTNNYAVGITLADISDNSVATNSLQINVFTNGAVITAGPLAITSTNQYSGTNVTYFSRPPFLAQAPTTNNSFTMRYYYQNLAAFDWPGFATAPAPGTIVPYLLPPNPGGGFTLANATNKFAQSLDIVYRPVWPSIVNQQPVPTLYSGQTLTTPNNNLAAVRGQGSVQVLYQQSIATNNITQPLAYQSVTLFDPTVQKTSYLGNTFGANKLPATVISTSYQGLNYFPNLPPNLVNRVWFDPGTTNLVLAGQFVQQTVGDNYLNLNVLRGADLAAVEGLCSTNDAGYAQWVAAVLNLSVPLYTKGQLADAGNHPIPGSYDKLTNLTQLYLAGDLVTVSNSDQQVDSYALATTGPGLGYISYIVGNSINPAHSGDPVTVYVARVGEYVSTSGTGLYPGQLITVNDPNPLSESISFQHTPDLGGNTANYQYDWRIQPPMNGLTPTTDPSTWPVLTNGNDVAHYTLGGAAGVQSLSDNFVAVRYRETDAGATAANTNWSAWTVPAFAPGYIKRVLTGINPFEQTTSDLFNNAVNTSANILTSAGARWEGDVALNASTLGSAGLIQIYETVLNRGKALSINGTPGINYGPANDALLLAAGEISDLYTYVASDALADAANPTIGIGTENTTYGSIATALFAFQGEEPTLLEEELALLRGRDDSVTTITTKPVYNRLYWNYTHGIASGEVIYALNYNILDENNDGVVDANDAAILFPMGHGDAYGHYLTALGNYYQLLLNPNFDWVPQAETVSILGASVAVNYEHERKFAASAGALAKTGLQVFDLTWRQGYTAGTANGWASFGAAVTNASPRTYLNGGVTNTVARYWGLDHWASRTGQGALINWAVGNAILPPVDPNPNDQGIQKVDRTTVPELAELPQTLSQLQADMDNAAAGFTPFDLSQNAIPFDINPLQVTGANPQTHFEQIYARALVALNNAVVAFNDAEGVTEEMRQQEDSLADLQAGVVSQELAYNNQLIELYGTPYPNDIGTGGSYPQGYTGPDLLHYTYVEDPTTNLFGGILPNPQAAQTNYIDIQQLPLGWSPTLYNSFESILQTTAPGYTDPTNNLSVPLVIGPDGFFDKPAGWTSQRASPGKIQSAISALLAAEDAVRQAADTADHDKQALDAAIAEFNSLAAIQSTITGDQNANVVLVQQIEHLTNSSTIAGLWKQVALQTYQLYKTATATAIPTTFIAGTADGGDVAAPAKGAFLTLANVAQVAFYVVGASLSTLTIEQVQDLQNQVNDNSAAINNLNMDADYVKGLASLGQQQNSLLADVVTINAKLRGLSDASSAYQALVAQGMRVQSDRLTYRQHAAALVQGYRTRDAAFRLFQNEKLERYQTLFSLAAKYGFLAAQAYDYETGLLGTPQGQAFLNRFISTQALGVVNNGIPQYSSTDSGDPGLASALAEMKGDWDVLKGRLGFNNPDGYGTTVSLRSENFRILAGTNGDSAWQAILQNNRVADVTADSDVRRLCLQIANSSGAPVPGIIVSFSTTITDGLNLFGNPLAPGDNDFTPSSFATKIFSVGVCLDGYIGMNNPTLGGGISPSDPTLDPNGLVRTPYVYLIPVGQDSMRSPPLGDTSTIRSWNVDDVAVPLPFNVSAANFASNPFYNAASSLSEPLFAVREHEAFRPVSTTSVFNTSIYGANGALQPTEYTNRRLIGRSIWNSKWKLVIPGKALLADPNQGLDRFIASVKDVKLYFITYSYAGN